MPTKSSVRAGGLPLIDYSLDLEIILESLEFAMEWYAWYDFYYRIIEYFNRIPKVEYAIGFDGVDDYTSIPNLDTINKRLEVKTNIWISRENQGSTILSLINSNNEVVFSLAATNEQNFQINAFYKSNDSIKSENIRNIAIEEWQNLSIKSDGEYLSINIDGSQEIFINKINLEDNSLTLKFGRGNNLRHFKGMIRKLKVDTRGKTIFNLQSGKEVDIEDQTNSAVIKGVHNIRKDRMEKEFN